MTTKPIAALLGLVLSATLVMPADAITLSEAMERALQQDPRVAQLESNYQADIERAEQRLASRRATVSAFADTTLRRDHSRSEFFGNTSEGYAAFALGVEARQPLYRRDWSERERQASAIVDQAGGQRDNQRQLYLLQLAERYFAVLAERENLHLAETEVETVARSLQDTRQRYEAEVIAATDLREAEARDDLARARLLAAEQQLDDARQGLQEMIGSFDNLPQLRLQNPEAMLDQQRSLEQWQTLASQASPALASARAAVTVGEGELASVRSQSSAQLDLFSRLAHQDNSGSMIGQRATEAVVGVELVLPLYSGGADRAASRQAAAAISSAEFELAALQRELARRVAAAWRARQVAARQVEAFGAVVRSAEAAEQAVRNGFEAGSRTMLEVLDASRATVEAERDLLASRYQLILSQLSLEQLAGELSPARFAEVDQWLVYPEGDA